MRLRVRIFGRTWGTEQIEISIDGERVALLDVDRWMHLSEPTGLNIELTQFKYQQDHRVTSCVCQTV